MHSKAPNNNYPAQNVESAEIEKPCSKPGLELASLGFLSSILEIRSLGKYEPH